MQVTDSLPEGNNSLTRRVSWSDSSDYGWYEYEN